MPPAIDLTRAQLFLDDVGVDSAQYVSRCMHPLQKWPDPVLVPEHPWELWCPVMYGTVLHWRGAFHMWYAAWTRADKPRICYAHSDDGLRWTKPALGLHEFHGNRDNNIVLASDPPRLIDDITVIDDPDDSEWPLKALYWEGAGHDKAKPDWGIFLARSRDGIHWDRSPGLVLPHWGDRFNAVSSRLNGKYVVFGRSAAMEAGFRQNGRSVLRTESDDLLNWSEPQLVLQRDTDDPIHMEIYSTSVFPYESLTLGGIERMYMSPDRLDTELAWSHDHGKHWRRARTRPAFIAPSEGARRWDDTWTNLPTNAPLRVHDRLWFYYSGRSGAHGSPYPLNHGAIGLATLRIDGFASLFAGERTGFVTTKAVTWPDGDLLVNVDPRRDLRSHPGFCSGEVRVELRDEQDTPIEGFTFADCVPVPQTISAPDASAPVAWGEGRSARQLQGRTLRIAFQLRDAHLYSWRASTQ